MKRIALLNSRWDCRPLAKNPRQVWSARPKPEQGPGCRSTTAATEAGHRATDATPGGASATAPDYGLMVHHETQVQVIGQLIASERKPSCQSPSSFQRLLVPSAKPNTRQPPSGFLRPYLPSRPAGPPGRSALPRGKACIWSRPKTLLTRQHLATGRTRTLNAF
jgi:hypothetical protein